jgi:exosortase
MSLFKSQRLILIIISVIIAGFTIFKPTLLFVFNSILNSNGNSHGIFIPFLAALMIWTKRKAIKDTDVCFDSLGFSYLILSILIPLRFDVSMYFKVICFIASVSSLCLTLLGRKLYKVLAFPMLYLTAITPIPEHFYTFLAHEVRDVTFNGSCVLLSFLGVSFYTNGWAIQLPNVHLNVELGCSGIHYLLSFFVFGIAYAYFRRSSLKHKLLIVALTIPIALLAGVLRVTTLTLLAYHIGARVVDPRPHMVISLVIFLSVAILCFSFDRFYQARSII